MLAAMLTVLALAGAPSSTAVTCNPALAAGGVKGITYSDTVIVNADGSLSFGELNHVSLGVTACGALLYASASTAERAEIRRLNPTVDIAALVGVGLEVALHESTHVALDSSDECSVEKVTRTKIDGLIETLADQGTAARSQSEATAADAALPAQYHGC